MDACLTAVVDATVSWCEGWFADGLFLAGANGCDSSVLAAAAERMVMPEFFSAFTDVGGFGSCVPPLRDLLLVNPIPGFEPLPPGSPEVGVNGLDQLAALFLSDVDSAREDLLRNGVAASVSAHFTRGGLAAESLVIRIDLFRITRGLIGWTAPSEEPAAEMETLEVPEVDIGRVTTARFERTGVTDYRSLNVQHLGFGRACLAAITVVYRSATDDVSSAEVGALLAEQASIIDANCDALTASVIGP